MKRIIVVLAIALAALGCDWKIAPYPSGAIPCNSDWACPDSMHCDFPKPIPKGYDGVRAQCLPNGGDDRWNMGSPPAWQP